jgi:hypothetical protein
MIDTSDLTAALIVQKTNPDKPLGMILVESGALSAKVIEDVVRQQIEEIISDLLGWEEGFFNFEIGEVSPKDRIEIDTHDFLLKSGLSAEYLLMEGTRILDERRKDQPRKATAPPSVSAPVPPKAAAPQSTPPPSQPIPITRTSSDTAREEFRSRIETAQPSRQITTLKSMFDELRFPTATAEVTLLILRYAGEVVNRAILFMVKKDEVRGLGQFGIELESEESADQMVRRIQIPLREPSLFQTVVETRRTYLGPFISSKQNNHLLNIVGGVVPDSVVVVPLIVDQKVVLIVYGDNLPEQKPIKGVETLEIFMNQAGMALEKALLERKISELQKEKR